MVTPLGMGYQATVTYVRGLSTVYQYAELRYARTEYALTQRDVHDNSE